MSLPLTLLLTLSLLPLVAGTEAVRAEFRPGVDRQRECVVLLHGLWRTSLSMKGVEWHLEDAGFQVINNSYPSFTQSIEESAEEAVSASLAECRALGFERVSFVTHSLGGILLRQYLSRHTIEGLDRAVMLGPPNQGSALADYVLSVDMLRLLQPEALEQLGTGQDSVPLRLGPVDFQLGVIAGDSPRHRYLPGMSDGPGDGTVSVAETVVPGMLDFLVLPVGHTFMMWSSLVLEQVEHFLLHGRFRRPAPGQTAVAQ